MKGWLLLMAVIIAALQYKLWFSDVGKSAERALARELSEQRGQRDALQQRNAVLEAEVLALKRDPRALEARARRDLGMIKQGEVFYFVPEADLNSGSDSAP
ncbi:MAG: septum formation initiator family protein [Pseudomonadales bacterium]